MSQLIDPATRSVLVARLLLIYTRLRKESVSAQTNRKRCESAKASVKFGHKKKKTEQEEDIDNGCNNNENKLDHWQRTNDQQPGRILETVNSDNKKSDPALPPPGFSFLGRPILRRPDRLGDA